MYELFPHLAIPGSQYAYNIQPGPIPSLICSANASHVLPTCLVRNLVLLANPMYNETTNVVQQGQANL